MACLALFYLNKKDIIMKSFATEIASAMSERIESEEHRSIFNTSGFGKIAAKKDDKKEDKKDAKEDKEEKKNPFAKKKDDKSDKKDDKKEDKKEDKKKDMKKKAEMLHAIVEGLTEISATL